MHAIHPDNLDIVRSLRRRAICSIVAMSALLLLADCTQPRSRTLSTITTQSGLQYTDTQLGDGPIAEAGATAVVHYTGWLYVDGKKGAKFDSSVDRGDPFEFPLGGGYVIAGWDEGVVGMKVGGKRTLILTPELGYGERGAGRSIPPNATLIFDVELLGLE